MSATFMSQKQLKFKDTLQAKKLFINHFPDYRDSVFNIKKILRGFSNKNFLLKTDDNQLFKVRITDNNQFISRSNEQEILKLKTDKNLLFYDPKTGNSIYKWIEGDSLLDKLSNTQLPMVKIHEQNNWFDNGVVCNAGVDVPKKTLSDEDMLKIYNLIKSFHDVKLPVNCEVLVHDAFDYFRITKDNISKKYQNLYKDLVNKYKDLPKVLCHNDVSEKNIICDLNDEWHLIDYEWGRVNVSYWDLGNWIRNSNLSRTQVYKLSKIASCSYEILLDFAFIASYYALQLAYSFGKSRVKEEYLIKTFNQLEMYLLWKQGVSLLNNQETVNTTNFK